MSQTPKPVLSAFPALQVHVHAQLQHWWPCWIQRALAQRNKPHTHFRFSHDRILSDSPVEMHAKPHLGHRFPCCWNWHWFPWGHGARHCVTPCASWSHTEISKTVGPRQEHQTLLSQIGTSQIDISTETWMPAQDPYRVSCRCRSPGSALFYNGVQEHRNRTLSQL